MNALVQASAAVEPADRPVAAAAANEEEKQYLTFMLGSEMFSLDILCIKEIIWYAGLTEVPLMPPCIRGVINLRGAVVPVMDLAARFGRPATPVGKSTCIVITEVQGALAGERQHMGIVVDAVQAVLAIPSSEIEPPPNFGARIRSDFIAGIAKVNGRFVILLNVQQVLSAEDIGALPAVAQAASAAPARLLAAA
jgi:purine-binding chemotaxis protein CheW